MQHHDDIKLAYIEEVDDRAHLILRHIWCQNKRFKTEFGEEVLDPVRLDDIMHHYHCFTFYYGELNHSEHQDKLI